MDTNTSLDHSDILLTKNQNTSTDTIVMFLPGISGKAFSERFQPLVEVSLEADLPIARVDAWKDDTDVQLHTYSFYHDTITEVVEHLQSLGYKKIIAVGKSFGGGLILSLQHPMIVSKILWAPAIGFAETETLNQVKDKGLSELSNLKDIKLSPSYLANDTALINIIHGTADDAFPIETSRKIIESVANGELIEIQNADHSFKNPDAEKALLVATTKFLTR